MAIRHISFLTPGNYPPDAPQQGLESVLQLFSQGEALGFDGAWVRQRHLERGISSAATFLAAASQRTRRIELGCAVIQMGYENPFRLAEDLATVDVLAGGRLQVGLSAGAPPFGALLGERLFDTDPAGIDFSHTRVQRLRDNLSGTLLGNEETFIESPAGRQRPQLHPYAPGLAQRLWYGGGSQRSARWAAEHGFHLLTCNLLSGELSDDFHTAQQQLLDTYRRHWQGDGVPRIQLGRVIVPTDSADAATRRRYQDYADSRLARTLAPQGERRTLFARDLVGSSHQIVAQLLADPIVQQVDALRLELPYDLPAQDYAQILHDFRHFIAPALGWQPASGSGAGRSCLAA